jgi:hypothetical protein
MQNFTPMERGPGKFLVRFSKSCSVGLDVLMRITFSIPSEYRFPVIMINQISDRNIHDMTLINTRMCKRKLSLRTPIIVENRVSPLV